MIQITTVQECDATEISQRTIADLIKIKNING